MVNQKGIILVASKRMDGNKKEDRKEDGLIRLSASARRGLGFTQGQVEVSPDIKDIDTTGGAKALLTVFLAFGADVRELKASGTYKPIDLKRVGFVTTANLERICGKSNEQNVWISSGVEDTVVGTDPEFLLFERDNDSIIHANNTSLNHTGLIGYDGAMAEIRPAPASDIEVLVDNMTNIFKNQQLTGCIQNLRWMSGCYFKNDRRDFPIGGHIHIGNPIKIAQFTEQKRVCLFVVMNRVMDELLAIPMTRLDGALGKTRRTNTRMAINGGYGFFGEWRLCNGRLEHRTLSGMWLKHPSLAKAVLGTAKAITDEMFKHVEDNNFNYNYFAPQKIREIIRKSDHNNTVNPESVWRSNFDGWGEIPLTVDLNCCRSSQDMRRILNDSKASSINKPFLDKWLGLMKGLSTYKKYQKYIDGLYEILLIPIKDISSIDREIQKNWIEGNPFPINL